MFIRGDNLDHLEIRLEEQYDKVEVNVLKGVLERVYACIVDFTDRFEQAFDAEVVLFPAIHVDEMAYGLSRDVWK